MRINLEDYTVPVPNSPVRVWNAQLPECVFRRQVVGLGITAHPTDLMVCQDGKNKYKQITGWNIDLFINTDGEVDFIDLDVYEDVIWC